MSPFPYTSGGLKITREVSGKADRALHNKHSDAYLEIYYEVRYAFWYGEKNILIDCDEAGALIESRIIKVSCKGDSLDIVTILNEKEVHGKL